MVALLFSTPCAEPVLWQIEFESLKPGMYQALREVDAEGNKVTVQTESGECLELEALDPDAGHLDMKFGDQVIRADEPLLIEYAGPTLPKSVTVYMGSAVYVENRRPCFQCRQTTGRRMTVCAMMDFGLGDYLDLEIDVHAWGRNAAPIESCTIWPMGEDVFAVLFQPRPDEHKPLGDRLVDDLRSWDPDTPMMEIITVCETCRPNARCTVCCHQCAESECYTLCQQYPPGCAMCEENTYWDCFYNSCVDAE